jgi:hypothetical protein
MYVLCTCTCTNVRNRNKSKKRVASTTTYLNTSKFFDATNLRNWYVRQETKATFSERQRLEKGLACLTQFTVSSQTPP